LSGFRSTFDILLAAEGSFVTSTGKSRAPALPKSAITSKKETNSDKSEQVIV